MLREAWASRRARLTLKKTAITNRIRKALPDKSSELHEDHVTFFICGGLFNKLE
jgi:hypothetical protein